MQREIPQNLLLGLLATALLFLFLASLASGEAPIPPLKMLS